MDLQGDLCLYCLDVVLMLLHQLFDLGPVLDLGSVHGGFVLEQQYFQSVDLRAQLLRCALLLDEPGSELVLLLSFNIECRQRLFVLVLLELQLLLDLLHCHVFPQQLHITLLNSLRLPVVTLLELLAFPSAYHHRQL